MHNQTGTKKSKLDTPDFQSQLTNVEVQLNEQLQFHITEPEVKEHPYAEYYIGLVGVIIIVCCMVYGVNTHGESLWFNLVLMTGSLMLLLGASNAVLEFAVKLAEALGVSELVIGLTIVSIGTSIPEIFTAIISARLGLGAIVIGDIYGSYITQLSIFLGIVILMAPLTVNRSFVPHVKRDGGLMLTALLILSLNISDGHMTRLEAGISMLIFFGYVAYLYITAKKNPAIQEEQMHMIQGMEQAEGIHRIAELETVSTNFNFREQTPQLKVKVPSIKIVIYVTSLLAGCLICYLGAHFVVVSGSNIARMADLPEHTVGATIIGFGTGFPEFVVSVAAVKRKKHDIAYGNLLGSNVVDPLFSISLGVLFNPISLTESDLHGILGILLPIAIITDIFIIIIFSRRFSKRNQEIMFGISFIVIYATFLVISFGLV